MTNILQTLVPFSIESTYDVAPAFVGAKLYKWDGIAWILINQALASLVVPGSTTFGVFFVVPYQGVFCAEMAAYTDGTLATYDPNFSDGVSKSWTSDPTLFPVEITVDQPGLPVGLKKMVYTSSWAQEGPTLAVPNLSVSSRTYCLPIVFATGNAYIVEEAVYTDGTFATYQDGYVPGSRSVVPDQGLNNAIANLYNVYALINAVAKDMIDSSGLQMELDEDEIDMEISC